MAVKFNLNLHVMYVNECESISQAKNVSFYYTCTELVLNGMVKSQACMLGVQINYAFLWSEES